MRYVIKSCCLNFLKKICDGVRIEREQLLKTIMYVHFQCLFACVELPQISVWICDVILYSCWCDLQFSIRFFRQMMVSFSGMSLIEN